jgi:hypothetical protein
MSAWSALQAEEQVLAEPSVPAADAEEERADLAALAVLWQLIAMLLNDPVFLPSVSRTAAGLEQQRNGQWR